MNRQPGAAPPSNGKCRPANLMRLVRGSVWCDRRGGLGLSESVHKELNAIVSSLLKIEWIKAHMDRSSVPRLALGFSTIVIARRACQYPDRRMLRSARRGRCQDLSVLLLRALICLALPGLGITLIAGGLARSSQAYAAITHAPTITHAPGRAR